MSGYSPVSNWQVNAVLQPGYTPPAPLSIDQVLPVGTEYEYKPSPYNQVNAILLPGYTSPAPLAIDATLTRTGGGTPGGVQMLGVVFTQFGQPAVATKQGAGLTQFMFLLAQ